MNVTFYDAIDSIFNPANNPFFTPSKKHDEIEEAVIIEEIKNESQE